MENSFTFFFVCFVVVTNVIYPMHVKEYDSEQRNKFSNAVIFNGLRYSLRLGHVERHEGLPLDFDLEGLQKRIPQFPKPYGYLSYNGMFLGFLMPTFDCGPQPAIDPTILLEQTDEHILALLMGKGISTYQRKLSLQKIAQIKAVGLSEVLSEPKQSYDRKSYKHQQKKQNSVRVLSRKNKVGKK